MKCTQRLRGTLLLAVTVIGAVSFAVFPSRVGAANSHSQTNPHDLTGQAKAFYNYSKDFSEMQEAAHGVDSEVLLSLENASSIAEGRLDAANAELQMYDAMSCSADRMKAKGILAEQLRYYVWAFDGEITRVNGELTFLKAPAAAQAGIQMKNDLRAAKEKLNTILASLR